MIRSLAIAFGLFYSVALVAAAAEEPGTKAKPKREESPEKVELSLSARNGSVEGLLVERRARGGVKAHLDGRFRHALVLIIAPDGSRSIECVDSPERAAQLLAPKQGTSPDDE
jgi:hypothetical protein